MTTAQVQSTAAIVAPGGAHTAGTLVGPFTVSTNQSIASVSVTGGYTLTDAVLRYDLPRLGGITLAASNLFDVDYVTYNSQTIRSTVAATDNARFFTGRGRTFTLGWDYRF